MMSPSLSQRPGQDGNVKYTDGDEIDGVSSAVLGIKLAIHCIY